ncbi:hypothetical protein V8E53_012509 [Lactarius tabidus]
MLSGKEEISQPSPSHIEDLPTEPDGRQGTVQDSLHDTLVGGHEPTLIEKRIFETDASESHPRFSGSEEEDFSTGNLERYSNDTSGDAGLGEALHRRPEATLEIENPGPHQSPPSSQPITPSALPLHLIPLLPQVSPSLKRQRQSIGLSSNQADKAADDLSVGGANATGGTTPSPQSLRSHLQNFSAEPAGISRTLAYAMDQMNVTPLRGAELEDTAMTEESEVEVNCEGDEATRPKTVRFEESTSQPSVELAERLWTDAVKAAVTARMREESEQKTKRAAQNSSQNDGVSCRQDGTVGGENTTDGTPEEAEGRPSKGVTSEMGANAWYTNEGGSGTLESEVEVSGSERETEGEILAMKPAQLQEYTRLKEREVELRRAGAEVRILEERLEAREKDLRTRLATVRQRLEAVRQSKASINCRQEIIRQKLEAITKETQEPASALGADATPDSS